MNNYQFVEEIGDGTYGTVYKAVHLRSKNLVAIKKMKQRYYSWEECLKLPEVKALRRLCNHANIIKLCEVIRENNELFFIFEYMDSGDLLAVIRRARANPPSDLTEPFIPHEEVWSYMYQFLQALSFLNRCGYFHRDCKPENLLVANDLTKWDRGGGSTSSTCHKILKLADFGLVKEIKAKEPYTDYVSTRWYRAPELLLQDTNYGSPMDIWAAGCIMCELISTKPLFQGNNEVDQLQKIINILGVPTYETWPEGMLMANKLHYTFRAPKVIFPLRKVMPNYTTPLQLNLIEKMLTYDPKKRITADQALQHPYFMSVGLTGINFIAPSVLRDKKLLTSHVNPKSNTKVIIGDISKKAAFTCGEGSEENRKYHYNTEAALTNGGDGSVSHVDEELRTILNKKQINNFSDADVNNTSKQWQWADKKKITEVQTNIFPLVPLATNQVSFVSASSFYKGDKDEAPSSVKQLPSAARQPHLQSLVPYVPQYRRELAKFRQKNSDNDSNQHCNTSITKSNSGINDECHPQQKQLQLFTLSNEVTTNNSASVVGELTSTKNVLMGSRNFKNPCAIIAVVENKLPSNFSGMNIPTSTATLVKARKPLPPPLPPVKYNTACVQEESLSTVSPIPALSARARSFVTSVKHIANLNGTTEEIEDVKRTNSIPTIIPVSKTMVKSDVIRRSETEIRRSGNNDKNINKDINVDNNNNNMNIYNDSHNEKTLSNVSETGKFNNNNKNSEDGRNSHGHHNPTNDNEKDNSEKVSRDYYNPDNNINNNTLEPQGQQQQRQEKHKHERQQQLDVDLDALLDEFTKCLDVEFQPYEKEIARKVASSHTVRNMEEKSKTQEDGKQEASIPLSFDALNNGKKDLSNENGNRQFSLVILPTKINRSSAVLAPALSTYTHNTHSHLKSNTRRELSPLQKFLKSTHCGKTVTQRGGTGVTSFTELPQEAKQLSKQGKSVRVNRYPKTNVNCFNRGDAESNSMAANKGVSPYVIVPIKALRAPIMHKTIIPRRPPTLPPIGANGGTGGGVYVDHNGLSHLVGTNPHHHNNRVITNTESNGTAELNFVKSMNVLLTAIKQT